MVTQYPPDFTEVESLLEKMVSSTAKKEVNKEKPFWERPWFQATIFFAALTAIIWFFIFLWDRLQGIEPTQSATVVSSVVASTTTSTFKTHFSYKGYKLSDFSTTTIYALIRKVQSEYSLRSLAPLESDVPLREQSIGTRPMVSASYLDITPPLLSYKDILNARTQKHGAYTYQFEVHKLSDSDINLMGFVSEESFVELNQSQASTTSVRLFPFPYKEFGTSYLVLIPINTIVSSDRRDVPVDDYSWGETATLLLTLRNWNQ